MEAELVFFLMLCSDHLTLANRYRGCQPMHELERLLPQSCLKKAGGFQSVETDEVLLEEWYPKQDSNLRPSP